MTKIIIVDDSQTELEVFANALRTEGFEVFSTTCSEDLTDMAAAFQPDFIILDLFMPNRSGLDVCRDLKIDPRTHSIPIMFLTSSSEYSDVVSAVHIGCIDYIHKPIATSELAQKIKVHDFARGIKSEWQKAMSEINRIENKYAS